MLNEIPDRWNSFLKDLDDSLEREISLVCIGGFVVAMLHNLERETSDLDFIQCKPREETAGLLEIAGEGKQLHKKHKVYLQHVTVAQLADNHEDRLTELFQNRFKHLRLYALGQYDLALSKLERNSRKDREDVMKLAAKADFDLTAFEKMYETEFKVYVEDNLRHRGTFGFWVDMIKERRSAH